MRLDFRRNAYPGMIRSRNVIGPAGFRLVQHGWRDSKLAGFDAAQVDKSVALQEFQILHHLIHVRKYLTDAQTSWPKRLQLLQC